MFADGIDMFLLRQFRRRYLENILESELENLSSPEGLYSKSMPSSSSDNSSSAGYSLSCFVVEDSPVIRQNLIATLEEMLAMQVIGFAEDENGAVSWMESFTGKCDLIIIDIFLRSGTGLEVLRRARLKLPQAKLVVLSNYATADMRRRCLQLGADRIFDKSAELEELLLYCEEIANSKTV
jgi:CheY-like chemotaxis protein